jgi:hypothetical protein
MPDEVTLDVTTIEENVTVETTAGDVVEIQVLAPTGNAATVAVGTTTTGAAGTNASVTNSGTTSAAVFNFTIPRGNTGATGATGPAGPNSVTSATTSDGTANLSLGDLEVVGGEIYTDGEYSSIYTQGATAHIFTLGSGAEIYTEGELAQIYTTGASAQIYTAGAGATIGTQGANATIYTTGAYATISTAGSAAHIQTSHASAAVKSTNFAAVESGGASLVDGSFQPCLTWSAGGRNLTIPSGTATTFNTTSYTYGTGAAAAHRTALGLSTLATTTPAANVATFLETPISANLAAAVTDETGSGALVFGTSPTLTTPTIAAINGGTSANDDITIQGTTNATRTTSYVNLQPNGGNVGIGTATPTTPLYIYTAGNNSVTIEAGTGDSQVAFRSGGSPRFLFGYEDADDGFRIYNYGTTSTALFVKSNTGNVGIGTTSPNAAALLDLTTTSKGFLPPRMTTTQRNAITSVPAGLMVYNTTTNKLNFYNGSAWEAVTSL